jgi:hypothetical protein
MLLHSDHPPQSDIDIHIQILCYHSFIETQEVIAVTEERVSQRIIRRGYTDHFKFVYKHTHSTHILRYSS